MLNAQVFRRWLLFVVLLVGSLTITAFPAAAQDTPQVTDEVLASLEASIQSEMAYFHIPGMAAAVVANGEIVYAQGFGLRDIENGEPFTAETRFRIGSTTKSMTSFLMAQLVDEGLIGWDTPVTDIFPDFATVDPELTTQIAVRDLMGMATGLESNPVDALGWGEWSVDDLLSAIAAQQQAGEYRQHFTYNNEVYALAGYAAVAVTGEAPTVDSYAALMQARVFDPIQMTHTLITDDISLLGDNVAQPYGFSLIGEGLSPVSTIRPRVGIAAPAGAVWSTVEDMARYVITQMNGGITPDGQRIVSAESLAETWQPGVAAGNESTVLMENVAYGMGWMTLSSRDIPVRYHDGGWPGYATEMVVFPDANIGLVLFANSSMGGSANQAITFGFAEALYGFEAQAVEQVHEQAASMLGQVQLVQTMLTETAVTEEVAAPLVGDYENGWQVTRRDDGGLWLAHGDWEFRIVPFALGGENAYMVVNNSMEGTLVIFDMESDPAAMVIQLPDEEARFNKLP